MKHPRAAGPAATVEAREAEAMVRLHDFSARILPTDGLQLLLEEVLDATVALHRADFGAVQQVEPDTGDLVIVAHRNLPESYVTRFARVHDQSAVSGRAMARRERVIVEDVLADALFEPHRAVAAAAGVRSVQSTPLVSRKGEVLGVISTLFREPHCFSATMLRFTDLYARHAADLVERNRAEAALLASQERFRRDFDLGLISRVTLMGELVASIAHEIGQPLAAIVGNGHAAVRWLAAQPPEQAEAVAAVQHIVADAHRASEVVAGIRRFLLRGEARRGPVDLHACVSEVARMLEAQARARHMRVQVEPRRGDAIFVSGDAVQLQQVILNLAMNGFDAMAAVPEAKRCLRLGVAVEGTDRVRVDVRDAGQGVALAQQARIFDAFHTSKATGMGLGLTISRSIVEAHGGRLWNTPNAGGGETFSFELPA